MINSAIDRLLLTEQTPRTTDRNIRRSSDKIHVIKLYIIIFVIIIIIIINIIIIIIIIIKNRRSMRVCHAVDPDSIPGRGKFPG